MVCALAMISLLGLHFWVCSLSCGMVRLGQTNLLSLDYGVFCVMRNFVVMDLCL